MLFFLTVANIPVEADSSSDAGGEIGKGKDLEPQQPAKTDTDEKRKRQKRCERYTTTRLNRYRR